MISSITRPFCVVVLFGGCALMAQSLAPQSLAPKSLTDNLDASPSNRASDLGSGISSVVKNASDSALSAAVSASVESESVTPVELPQYTGGMQGRRLFEQSMRSVLGSPENRNVSALGSLKSQNTAAFDTGMQENSSRQYGGLSAGSLITRQQWIHGINTGGAGNPFRSREGALPQAFQRAGNLTRTCKRMSHPLQNCKLQSDESTQEAAYTDEATYSIGFPDSTRGNALASPPDLGTASPLTGIPDFSPGIEGFGENQLLNPSLRVSARRMARRRRTRHGIQPRNQDSRVQSKPPTLLTMPSPELPGTESQPATPSIEQQLGLQQ